ncbi:MAG TPA: galactokinase [Victivallales bacterium]|nr:galactokinase [Victivallales bacterium]
MPNKSTISNKFANLYNAEPEVIASAPGRIEVLGNHTDYNEGYVLSAATDLYTIFAVKKNDSIISKITSFDIDKAAEFKMDELDKKTPGLWSDYIKGVAFELSKIAQSSGLQGFDAGLTSEVPLSAGMSSSAALEISTCFALGKLYGIELEPEEWAKLGQRVENNYMGLKSGLLDQFSSVYGKKDKLILCDFRSVEVLKTVKFPSDYEFVIVNSMIEHNLVDSDYNARRESCERAVCGIKKIFPKIKALRDVSIDMLHKAKDSVDLIDFKRALHIVSENTLVQNSIAALEKGDIELFGSYLYESHKSSKENFENSCPELDYLIELSKNIPGCAGARLSGGGFGGISIHLVKRDMADQYKERIATAFKLQTGVDPQTFVCGVGDGAHLLDI